MKRKQAGVAIVEFALILPFLLLLTFLTTEFGRAIWQYNTLTKSVRDAARYLSVQTPADPVAIANARNLMVYGNIAGTGNPLALGLSLTNVPVGTCCTWQTAGSAPVINTVTVRISGYSFQSMFTTVLGLRFGSSTGKVPFSDITATMRSHL
jgi:Flp pilus assembly protein TadG